MKGQIKYNKINGFDGKLNGYQVTVKVDGEKTEFPFESKIFSTKRDARKAVENAYHDKCWNLNMAKNTIDIN